MGALRDIIVRFGPGYVEHFGEKMPESHLEALFAATFCRTEVMGGHTRECDNCGDTVLFRTPAVTACVRRAIRPKSMTGRRPGLWKFCR